MTTKRYGTRTLTAMTCLATLALAGSVAASGRVGAPQQKPHLLAEGHLGAGESSATYQGPLAAGERAVLTAWATGMVGITVRGPGGAVVVEQNLGRREARVSLKAQQAGVYSVVVTDTGHSGETWRLFGE